MFHNLSGIDDQGAYDFQSIHIVLVVCPSPIYPLQVTDLPWLDDQEGLDIPNSMGGFQMLQGGTVIH